MNTPTPMRPMPVTDDDVDDIRVAAEAFSGTRSVYSVDLVRNGALVRYEQDVRSPREALERVGYTVTTLRPGLVLVTGAVDQVALLDAEIARLTEVRNRLAVEAGGAS